VAGKYFSYFIDEETALEKRFGSPSATQIKRVFIILSTVAA
jgi:hypothetical protein